MYKKIIIFLMALCLFSCSSDNCPSSKAEEKVVEGLKKANAKDFSFSLLSVNGKEVTIEQVKKNLKNPAGWTIKSIKIEDTSFGDVTGTGKNLKITIKKGGTFGFSITLQKAGYVDYALKGSIKASGDVFLLIFDKATKTVTGVTDKTIKSINIPATIDGVAVTTIGKSAFKDCRSLTAVTIPDSVTTIGESAFRHCRSLTAVTLPNKVTTIGAYAFSGCRSLTAVTIPNKVTTIEAYIFNGCSSLKAVTIPNSVTTIGKWAFWGCSSLTAVTIPNKVTTIGAYTFYNCSALTAVTIPNSVTTIGKWAFWGCKALASVTIPNSVTTIGNVAFAFCSKLTSLTIPNSVTTIGEWAFSYCGSLTSVNIPNSVTKIENGTFNGCSSLTAVTIPDLVTTIGEDAFSGCKKLSVKLLQNNPMKITFEKRSIIGSGATHYAFGKEKDKSTWVKEILVPSASLAAYKQRDGIKLFASIMKIY